MRVTSPAWPLPLDKEISINPRSSSVGSSADVTSPLSVQGPCPVLSIYYQLLCQLNLAIEIKQSPGEVMHVGLITSAVELPPNPNTDGAENC